VATGLANFSISSGLELFGGKGKDPSPSPSSPSGRNVEASGSKGNESRKREHSNRSNCSNSSGTLSQRVSKRVKGLDHCDVDEAVRIFNEVMAAKAQAAQVQNLRRIKELEADRARDQERIGELEADQARGQDRIGELEERNRHLAAERILLSTGNWVLRNQISTLRADIRAMGNIVHTNVHGNGDDEWI